MSREIGARPRLVWSSTPVALTTGVSRPRLKICARSAADSGAPAEIACRAISTQIGCGSPVLANVRASASTDGGRAAGMSAVAIVTRSYSQAAIYGWPVLSVDVVRLDPDLALPEYAHAGDAGLDLLAREDGVVAPRGGRLLMPTGIAIAIPVGHAAFVLPRSGLALKHGLTIANAPGLIDAACRGEVKVVLLNTDAETPYKVHRGDRIAQLVVQRVEQVSWKAVAALEGDDRGGGFGHSGR